MLQRFMTRHDEIAPDYCPHALRMKSLDSFFICPKSIRLTAVWRNEKEAFLPRSIFGEEGLDFFVQSF